MVDTAQKAPATFDLPADSLGYSLLLAAKIIAQVRAGRSLNIALNALQNEALIAKSAAQDLVYGVLRDFPRAPFMLARLMEKPLTHPETEALLWCAMYRLQTRANAEAMIVDQAVIAAGQLSGGVFKGLVNGVLRNFLRQKEALLKAIETDEEAHWQMPLWWIKRLAALYPKDWQEIIRIGNKIAPMCLRVNVQKTSVEAYLQCLNAANIPHQHLKDAAILLKKPMRVEDIPHFFAGFVSIQDFGAQRAAQLLNAALTKNAYESTKNAYELTKNARESTQNAYVLDACAAPGGKAAHLLESADINLTALDIDAKRSLRISENMQRLGLSAQIKTVDCITFATEHLAQQKPLFDAILADVPCSASGVLRRHPDIKMLRRDSDIRQFKQQQSQIIDALWQCLKEGGTMLYATCSIFPEENDGQIDAFLFRHQNAQLLQAETWLPNEEHDGFYYALLLKQSEAKFRTHKND